MSGNITPIYSRVGDVSNNATSTTGVTLGAAQLNQAISWASNDYTGANANTVLIFTADPTNGSYVQRLRFKSTGTTSATVARIFLNNGGNGSAANSALYGELSLPATTAVVNAATIDVDYPMNFALNPGFRLFVAFATAPSVAGVGWVVTPIAGKY